MDALLGPLFIILMLLALPLTSAWAKTAGGTVLPVSETGYFLRRAKSNDHPISTEQEVSMNGKHVRLFFGKAVVVAFLITAMALAVHSAMGESITRGASTGRTTAKRYDHPHQYLSVSAQTISDNKEPVIPHADQEKSVREKLAELEKMTGNRAINSSGTEFRTGGLGSCVTRPTATDPNVHIVQN